MANKRTLVVAIAVIALMHSTFKLSAQQTLTIEDKAVAAETLYKLLDRYAAYGTLKSFEKTATNRDIANKYVALFIPESEVINEIKPTQVGGKDNKPQLTTIEQYADDNLEVFQDGLLVEIKNAVIDFTDLANETVVITIEKFVTGKAINTTGVGYNTYRSQTTLQLSVRFVNGFSLAKITKVSLIKGNISCADCEEQVHEVRYKTPFEFAMTLAVDAPFSSTTSNTPDYTKFNYDDLITTNTRYSNYKNKMGYGAGLNLSFDFMFTKQRNVGFAIALGYSHQSSAATLDTLHLQYTAHNVSPRADNNFYYSNFLRYNTAYSIRENISTNNLGVSFLFKYQSDVAQKVGFFMQFGPSYYFYNQSTSKYSATVDHEAVYQPTITQQPFDNTGYVAPFDWVITRAQVSRNLSGNQTVEELFESYASRKGANVYINKSINGTQKNSFKLAVGGVLALGAAINLSEKLQLLAGANLNVIYYSGSNIFNQELSDENDYNSMLNAVDKTLRINYGLTLGLKFRLATLN